MGQLLSNRLFSLRASGTIGDAWTFSKWKDCFYVKKWTFKAISESPEAIWNRLLFLRAVIFWNFALPYVIVREAWRAAAEEEKNPNTGYSCAMASMLKAQKITAKTGFTSEVKETDLGVEITFRDLDDLFLSREPGKFTAWCKHKGGPYAKIYEAELTAGKLIVPKSKWIRPGGRLKVLKDGTNRTGVILLTK